MTGNVRDDFCIYTGVKQLTMKPKKKQKKLRITEKDLLLANRRAARIEEIEAHGRPVSFRKAIHKSKKVYDRKALKRQASGDDLPFLCNPFPAMKRKSFIIGINSLFL